MRDDQGGKRLRQNNKANQKVGRRRRMLLASLLICVGVLVSLSLGALAQQPPPAVPCGSTPPAPAPSTPVTPEPKPPSVPPELTPAPPRNTEVPVRQPRDPLPSPAPGRPSSEWGATTPFDFSQPAPERAAVEDSWFSSAVFLGDSRSDGLRLYSGIQGADFLAYKSQMVFHVTGGGSVQARAIPKNGTGEKRTTFSWLEEKQYTAVYVMFGINELGYNNDTAFADAFRQLIAGIRTRQPEAVIYIQSLVPINPEKTQETNPAWWLNNDRVANYNTILQQVCAEKGAVYLNVQEALVDENGALPSEGTTDGIHFTKSWYQKWYAYLKTHTVDPDAYTAGLEALENAEEAAT